MSTVVLSPAFLSPWRCAPGTLASPLARALAETDPHLVRDLSLDGKVELRGDLDLVEPGPGEELVRLSPRRGFLFTDGDTTEAIERLRAQGVRAYDATATYAGLAVEGEQLMRRLTDLDLDKLPGAGGFARIGALLVRDEGERFRIYFQQELGHYVAEVVLDALAGLPNQGQTPGPVPSGDVDGAGPDGGGDLGVGLGMSGRVKGSDPGADG